MKIKFLLVLCILSASLSHAQEIARVESFQIKSGWLHQDRPVLIYTPRSYDENILVSYDVIYVFDSQNRELFDLVHSLIRFTDIGRNYIVVGITSPYYEDTDYARNHDYLPEPLYTDRKDFYGGYCCNSANLKKFVSTELVPYIDRNYRTTKNKISIGHSLSASFIIDFMLTDDFFNAYLAISPNFAYDKEQLARSVVNFDFKSLQGNRFLYITHANENWSGWPAAREKVYAFLSDTMNISDKIYVDTAAYPDEDHWFGYLPALQNGLKSYFNYDNSRKQVLSKETYKAKIRVKTPRPDDEVFITGNQPSLGNWNPGIVQMKKLSDSEREVELMLHIPALILFTRGDMDTRAVVNHVYINDYITIDPSVRDSFEFEIIGWFDDED